MRLWKRSSMMTSTFLIVSYCSITNRASFQQGIFQYGPPPPTFPLPFPFNHCEALIWSHELHMRCVDFIANISGPQLGPKTMLMESVAFQYSENPWHLWISFKQALSFSLSVFLCVCLFNSHLSKVAEHVLPSYERFKNLWNCWKFWLYDTN